MMFGGPPRRGSRVGRLYAAFMIVSLVLLLASRTPQARAVQEVGARALDPVRHAITGIGDGVAGIFGTIGEIDRLRTENERLRALATGMQERVSELTEAARENAQLRQLLGLRATLDMQLLPVRVLSVDPSNFTWEVGVDAGADDGLEAGMAVVGSADGAGALAGTVVSVTPDTARVRYVVDTRSRVIALDQRSRALGLIQGRLGGDLLMADVAVTDDVAPGDAIISSGLAGEGEVRSRYPRGLLIGEVQAVETAPGEGLTQTAFVAPALDFRRLDRLLVVLSYAQD
jgi:rod shape-determining protein MreC